MSSKYDHNDDETTTTISSKHQEEESKRDSDAPPTKRSERKKLNVKKKKKKKEKKKRAPKEKVEDLWVKLLKKQASQEDKKCVSAELRESNVIVVGSRGSGKSTLIHSFLHRESEFKAKATAALEYTFGRRNVGHDKEVVHVWELGGGVKSNELLDTTFDSEKLERTSLVVVIDTSNPGRSFFVLRRWMEILQSRVEKCELKLRADKPEKYETLKRESSEPFEEESSSNTRENISTVPVLIVMSHYEAFLEKASLKRRVVTQAIRVLAHVWGANVVGYDRKFPATKSLIRSMLSKAAFGEKQRSAVVVEKVDTTTNNTTTKIKEKEEEVKVDPDAKEREEKKRMKALRVKLRRFGLSKKMMKLNTQAPVVVPMGADSHEKIGAPPDCDATEYEKMSGSLKIKLWSKAVLKYYPDADREVDQDQEEEEEEEENEEEKKNEKVRKFADEVIDSLCAQKREELVKYRKAAERQRRLKGKS